jgi:methylated-DNA-[protein]-cysteine S-methyltransferase
MELQLNRITSPLGEMLLVTDAQGTVWALDFTNHVVRLTRELRERHGDIVLREDVPSEAAEKIAGKIKAYFKGDLNALMDIPVTSKGTGLENRVWAALRKIAAGTTTTYGELARSLGFTDPRMAKEIGAAISANPVAVIVPCHRVIGKDGSLRGYAWGLQRKQYLLAHEKVDLGQDQTAALFALATPAPARKS